jgi:hypothetical protein
MSSSTNTTDAMEVEPHVGKDDATIIMKDKMEEEEDDEEEEDVSDLLELIDDASAQVDETQKIAVLTKVLTEPKERYGPKATNIKERAVYDLVRAYCQAQQYPQVVQVLTGSTLATFFLKVTKAKAAKVVRQVLDIVCSLAPQQLEMVCTTTISRTIGL